MYFNTHGQLSLRMPICATGCRQHGLSFKRGDGHWPRDM